MITKQQLTRVRRWLYAHITRKETMMMSGWKFYIFGRTVEDSFRICQLLMPIIEKYDVTTKVATEYIIKRNTQHSQKEPAWSAGVMYLHPELFKEKLILPLITDIQMSLQEYSNQGIIEGAKLLDGKLHYRFDLNEAVNPEEGLPYEKYLATYRGENGPFNIPENKDIWDYLKP